MQTPTSSPFCGQCGAEAPAGASVCPQCGANLDFSRIRFDQWMRQMEDRMHAVEVRLPESDIIHHKFWKRAWTVFGYNLATSAIIYGIMFAVWLVIMMLMLFMR